MLEPVTHAVQEDVTGLCAPSENCVGVDCCPPDDFAYLIPPVPPVPTGACCIRGQCSLLTEAACAEAGGTYLGDNTVCSGDPCAAPPPPPAATGACCIGGVCSVLTQAACEAAGGIYKGDNVPCLDVTCGGGGGGIPNLPVYPPPDRYPCVGDNDWGPCAMTDPIAPNDTHPVAISPGGLTPDVYVANFGAPGCLAAWAQETWSQFLAAGIPFSQARLIWGNTNANPGWMGTQVFPFETGPYNAVLFEAATAWTILVEYCPLII